MLNYQREFIVLADCLNYTTASRRLNVSQPSLSRHIANLEKELGFRLFKRNPMALTPAGKYYMKSISNLIEQYDEITKQGRLIEHGDSQSLSIYMLPSKGPFAQIVYESITRMHDELPGFSPYVCYNDRLNTTFEAVESGKADVGILLDKPATLPADLVCEWLVDAPSCAWVHENNPVLKLQTIRMEDLADCSLVCSTNRQSHTWFDSMVTSFRKYGMDMKVHLKDIEDHTSFFIDLAPDEVLLDTDMGETVCQYNRRLVNIKFDNPTRRYSSYLIYRKEPERFVTRKFVEACHQIASEYQIADTSK